MQPLVGERQAQLGLRRLDANWLADEDGISQIAVRDGSAGSAADFIPYTERAIQWHTDGYYHPQQRRIRAMVQAMSIAPSSSAATTRRWPATNASFRRPRAPPMQWSRCWISSMMPLASSTP